MSVGDVIYIEANSGAVKRVGRCDAYATEFDLEAEEYVPLPKVRFLYPCTLKTPPPLHWRCKAAFCNLSSHGVLIPHILVTNCNITRLCCRETEACTHHSLAVVDQLQRRAGPDVCSDTH